MQAELILVMALNSGLIQTWFSNFVPRTHVWRTTGRPNA